MYFNAARLLGESIRLSALLVMLVFGVACGSAVTASSGGVAEPSIQTTASPRATAAAPPAKSASKTGEVDRSRFSQAGWAPGQLQAHFDKHGSEGPYRSVDEYDEAARETIGRGTHFTYADRESNAERHGFYDQPTNRFTGLTRDGRRITTHFKPDRREAYVRGLERSTYPR